jgi:lipopolysaccharide/colanic/teichoic acid biosynthesis glycosyltransferase
MVESQEYSAVMVRESALEDDLQPRGGRAYEVITGIYNRVLAAAVLVLLSPLWLAIALAIRLTSPGPVLFRAPVVGRNGRVFRYYKFRTMHVDTDNSEHVRWIEEFVRNDRPYSRDASGRPVYKFNNGATVTAIGGWLRRFSLDEVPQMLNVLRGDMNIVGPRPPVLYEYDLYGPDERKRLAVKPGITGLYQARRRGRASFSEMLQLDLEYIRRRSLWLDILIILKTPWVMLKGREVM